MKYNDKNILEIAKSGIICDEHKFHSWDKLDQEIKITTQAILDYKTLINNLEQKLINLNDIKGLK